MEPFEGRFEHPVEHGRHDARLEMLDLPVELGQHIRRITGFQRIRPQRAAEPAHHHRRRQVVPDNVADHDAQPAGRQREHVVPVARHARATARHITRGEIQERHGRQARRQQAALQLGRGRARGPRTLCLHGERDPIPGHLQQLDVVFGEPARGERADVQHAEHVPIGRQRHTEQGTDARLPEQRVDHRGPVDAVEDNGFLLRRDPAGETAADRDTQAGADLRAESACGHRRQLVCARFQQQHHGRVDVQHFADAVEQLDQHFLAVGVHERIIADQANPP